MTTVPEAAPQNAVLRYSNIAVTFHWAIGVLVLTQAVLGFTFAFFAADGPGRDAVFVWHKTLGVLIFLLALARLGYRLKNPPPPFPPELPVWERYAAVWNHRLFYLLLLAMPIVGFLAVSGHAHGPTTPLVGGIAVPVIPGVSRETGELAGDVHEIAAFLLVALILLHVAAALKHEFIDHWRGSARMPPFSAPEGEQVVVGQGLQEG
jgi:cytochrome b561